MKKQSLLFVLIGILIPIVLGFVFLYAGGMPVATKGSPLPFERNITKIAIHAAMRNEVNKASPIEPTEENLIAGAKIYVTNCAVCHGQPGANETAIAKGLFPKPPQLFSPDDYVTDDPVGEIYWKARNGLRLTGMPGFVDALNDTELWQVSLLLQNADKISESTKSQLVKKQGSSQIPF